MTVLAAGRARRARDVGGAFLRIGYLSTIGYPLQFLLSQGTALLPVMIFFFVARIVGATPDGVGGDYFTYVAIALAGLQVLSAGLHGFGQELEFAIQQGRLEMLLVEPVRWRSLPVLLGAFPTLARLATAGVMVTVTLALGADVRADGIPAALGVAALGLIAGAAIGILAAAVKVLAKRGDPIITIYMLGASILSGVYFPLDELPAAVRWISWTIPNTYVVGALRRCLMPDGASLDGPGLGPALAGLAAFDLVLLPVALWLFGRALRYGRRMGVLGSY